MTDSRSDKRFGTPHHPVEIRLQTADKALEVDFDDGSRFRFTAEFLRVHSPSAEVQGHGASERRLLGGCRAVGIVELEPVGHYAIRIRFDDGHDTGLFSWKYLYKCGQEHDALWRTYLDQLKEKGLSREAS